MTIGQDEINVKVTGSVGDVQGAMRDASASVREGSGKMSDSLSDLDRKLEEIERDIANVGKATEDSAGRIGFAAGAWSTAFNVAYDAVQRVSGAVIAGISKQIELGDELDRTSKKTGMSAEAITGLAYAADIADIPLKSLTTSLRLMQQHIAQAERGSKSALATFDDMHVSLAELRDLSPDQQFDRLADAIAAIEDPAERTRLVVAAFGRSGADLLPLFEQGSEGIRKAREEAEKLGLTLNRDGLTALADADEAMKKLNRSADGLYRTLAVKLGPVLAQIADGIRNEMGGTTEIENLQLRIARLQSLLAGNWIVPWKRSEWEGDLAALEQRLEELTGAGKVAAFDKQNEDIRFKNAGVPLPDLDPSILGSIPKLKAADPEKELAEREKAQARIEQFARVSQQRMDAEATRAAEQAQREIERILVQHQREQNVQEDKMLADRSKRRERAARQLEESLTRMFDPISQAFDGMLQGVLSGTQTMQQAFSRMGLNIAASYANMAMQAIANFIKMKVVAIAMGRDASLAQVKQSAAAAASAAYASAAKIPYVGWILGPIAAAAAYAGSIAFASNIPSARGGYDVPAGVNPMTQIHEREMVLPQKYADVIRAQAEGGGRQRGGGQISLNVQGMAGDSFIITRDNLAQALRQAAGADGYRYA